MNESPSQYPNQSPVARRVSFHTLGCKLNVSESATLGRAFIREGFTLVPFGDPSDVVVLNTCTVTERADRECRQIVRRVKRQNPEAYVAVVGCYAQLQPDQIAAIPGVNLVAGSVEKFNIIPHIRSDDRSRTTVLRADHSAHSTAILSDSSGIDRTRAFLKVQDGCDYVCSFCTIPLARGASRSVPFDAILENARALVDQGFREIVLTGVNTGDYGRKEGGSLASLLRALARVDGLERLRISSVEPNLLSDELLDVWFSESNICKHWHIPLQSGSEEILRRMRRRYQRGWYEDRLLRVKRHLPDACFGADVIVGFPGETDRHFEETVAFLRDNDFSYLHVFTYSERPNTDAAALPDRIDVAVKADRSERLRGLSVRKRRSFYESFRGREVDVLFESYDETGSLVGTSSEYIKIKVDASQASPNTRAMVTVEEVGDEACTGSVRSFVGDSPKGKEMYA